MHERIRAVMADIFGVPADQIRPDATNEDLEQWTSLQHLELMMAIEMEFGVTVSSEAMPELLSVGAIDEYVREQGAAAA